MNIENHGKYPELWINDTAAGAVTIEEVTKLENLKKTISSLDTYTKEYIRGYIEGQLTDIKTTKGNKNE